MFRLIREWLSCKEIHKAGKYYKLEKRSMQCSEDRMDGSKRINAECLWWQRRKPFANENKGIVWPANFHGKILEEFKV